MHPAISRQSDSIPLHIGQNPQSRLYPSIPHAATHVGCVHSGFAHALACCACSCISTTMPNTISRVNERTHRHERPVNCDRTCPDLSHAHAGGHASSTEDAGRSRRLSGFRHRVLLPAFWPNSCSFPACANGFIGRDRSAAGCVFWQDGT